MQGAFEFYRDLPVRPKRPERLFFGLFPDTETAIRIGRLVQQFLSENHLEGARIRPERLHVSLRHLGDYKSLRSKFVYAARQAGSAVSMHPFEMTFRSIKCFEGAPSSDGKPRRRPLVLLAEGDALLKLHEALDAAMEKNGLRRAVRFTPHMTLSYGPKPIPMQGIEPIRVAIDGFALVHSKLWLTQYSVIERWPLRG